MVEINVNLVKKRSEHHDGLLIDLEEISLHQQGIRRIDFIGSVCKNLRILLLQNNLIEKIENLNKLKDLEYLNLALNNIRRIEGLSSCESLRKLDLTVNYIDFDSFISSLESLRDNYNLQDLYLSGNPVSLNWDKTKYRVLVVGMLPQLKQLDGELISACERINAKQSLGDLKLEVNKLASECLTNPTKSAFTPESRSEMYFDMHPESKQEQEPSEVSQAEPTPVLNIRGEIRQCNEGGYKYRISETVLPDGQVCLVFELETPKYMDTSLIEVDLNPTYVRCIVKGRVTQIKFDDEIEISNSTVCRSKTTGWLKIISPVIGRRGRIPTEDIPPLERI